MLQQPTQNIFNVGNTPQIQFEARYSDGSVNPNEVIVQHKTAFIDLKNGLFLIILIFFKKVVDYHGKT